jgi:lysozyme family protein
MAASSFPRALSHVLAHEGGFVNHPVDPGGATNLGVTRPALSAWRGRPAAISDVKALTRAEAAALYRARYWDAIGGDSLPAGLDLAAFDLAVNSGVGRARRMLKALPAGAPDVRITALCAARLAFLRGLKTWPVFGKGWARRVAATQKAALALAGAAPIA